MKPHKIIQKLEQLDIYHKIEINYNNEVSVFYESLNGEDLRLIYDLFAGKYALLLSTEDKYIVVTIYKPIL